MEVSLKNILFDGIVERLQDRLITQVDDDTKATIVRQGRLQEDPTKQTGINVLVWSPEESKTDELYTKQQERHTGLHSPTYEIGGGFTYYRRLVIYFLFHFKGYKGDEMRAEAARRTEVIISRIRHEILTMPLPLHPVNLVPQDDFGETAILPQIDTWWTKESGGPGNFIWKGEIHFGYLTEHFPR